MLHSTKQGEHHDSTSHRRRCQHSLLLRCWQTNRQEQRVVWCNTQKSHTARQRRDTTKTDNVYEFPAASFTRPAAASPLNLSNANVTMDNQSSYDYIANCLTNRKNLCSHISKRPRRHFPNQSRPFWRAPTVQLSAQVDTTLGWKSVESPQPFKATITNRTRCTGCSFAVTCTSVHMPTAQLILANWSCEILQRNPDLAAPGVLVFGPEKWSQNWPGGRVPQQLVDFSSRPKP